MKKVIICSLLGAALFSFPFVYSSASAITSTSQSAEKGYVSVSYTAEKEVSPDTVEVSIAVRTDDKKSMQTAIKENKEISDKVYEYLKGAINTANGDYLKTTNYSAAPSYVYNSGKRSLDKYEVSNNIIVHTKSLDKISEMIDKSLALGATTVNSLNFSLSEKDSECADLLTQATKQARKRADIVAAAAATTVSGIRNIDTSCSVNTSYPVPQFRNMLMAKSSGAMDSATSESAPIEAGVIKVYSSVNANFYLK